MSRRFTILVVAVVAFVLGGLLSHSVLSVRADAPQAAPGHGKCVAIKPVFVPTFNTVKVYRAFEDGTVEMKADSSVAGSTPWTWQADK